MSDAPRGPASRLWPLLCVAVLVVAFATAALRVDETLVEPGRSVQPNAAMKDFRDIVWTPARDLFAGNNPYDHDAYMARHPNHGEFDLYLPAWLLASAPLAALPFRVAVAAAVVINALLACVLARLLLGFARRERRMAPGREPPRSGPALHEVAGLGGLLLLVPSITLTHTLGQATLVVVIGVLLAVDRERSDWWRAAGVALALVKPQFGLPLVLILGLGLREWRVALRGVVVAVVLSLPVVAAVVIDAGGVGNAVDIAIENYEYGSSYFSDRSDDSGFWRVDLGAPVTELAPDRASTTVTAVQALVVLAITVLVLRRRPRLGGELTAAVIACGVLLAVPHVNYDASLLVWPVALALLASPIVLSRWRVFLPATAAAVLVIRWTFVDRGLARALDANVLDDARGVIGLVALVLAVAVVAVGAAHASGRGAVGRADPARGLAFGLLALPALHVARMDAVLGWMGFSDRAIGSFDAFVLAAGFVVIVAIALRFSDTASGAPARSTVPAGSSSRDGTAPRSSASSGTS
jgi:hypothetical protein